VSEFEILLYCCLVLYTGIIYSTTNNFWPKIIYELWIKKNHGTP
jgi:hypothetical protein